MPPFEDDNEILLRQVHPNFIRESRITSQAFLPTEKDDKKLSVNCSSMISAQEAFELHTTKKNLKSVGVWGVSVEEVQLSGLSIESDPIETLIQDKSHSFINFTAMKPQSPWEENLLLINSLSFLDLIIKKIQKNPVNSKIVVSKPSECKDRNIQKEAKDLAAKIEKRLLR